MYRPAILTALALGATLAIAISSMAQEPQGATAQSHQEPRWKWRPLRLQIEKFPWDNEHLYPPGPPRPGITTIYLHGFEKIYDVYTVAYRFEPHVRQPPHTHPDRRSCFVLAGRWHFAYGTDFDPAAFAQLLPGAHYAEPANVPHYAMSGPDGAVVECTAHGPSGTTFVPPEDE